MKIESIASFLTVANKGSMSEAAESVFTTPQNMSFILKNLEAELGIELFIRTNKGVTLTEEGQQFFPFAVKIVQTYREYQLTRTVGVNTEKILRLYTTNAVGSYLDFLPELELTQNRMLSVIPADTEDILQNLKKNIPGIYIVPVNNENMQEFKKWQHIVLGAIQYVNIYADRETFKGAESQIGEDLTGLTCFDIWTKHLDGLWNGAMANVEDINQAKRIMKKRGYVYLMPDLFANMHFPENDLQWDLRHQIKIHGAHELLLLTNLLEEVDFEMIGDAIKTKLFEKNS